MTTPRATTVSEGEDGIVRALILQSTQAQLGALRIGVMSARLPEPAAEIAERSTERTSERTAEPAQPGARARLRLVLPEGVSEYDVGPGELIDLGPLGQLGVAEVRPQESDAHGPEIPIAARGHVVVAWRAGPTGARQG